MERPFVTPLPPHRGRHAGILSTGLLAATTTVVWISHDAGPSKVDPRPTPAASVPRTADEPPRFQPIELGPEIITVVATERELTRVVTASGALTFDDSRTNHLRTPVAGVLVKTRPSSLGRVVRAGEIVGVVYSLEVFVATADLLAELREFRGQEHVDRERWRLLRWGMRPQQLRQIEQSMTPSAALPIIARVTGKVVAEEEGARQLIDPSIGDLLTITDPAYASIYVDVPAADAALLRVGQTTQVTLSGTPRPFAAPIGYISRSVEDGVKIVRVDLHPVRLKVPPAKWKEVEAKIDLARVSAIGPVIPVAAVVRSGTQTVVYVVRGEVAEPRDVRLGPASNGYVLVEAGIAIGDVIAIQR